MADELRDNAQQSSLDHMASLGKAALTVGVGAALFYRGGGRKFLSEGARISERVLRDAQNEIGSRNLKQLTTTDVKQMYNSLVGSPDSALNRAKQYAKEGPMLMRKDHSQNLTGGLQENYLRLLREQEKIARERFETQHVRYPTAQEFVRKFAPDNPTLGRQIERFAFDAGRGIDDANAVEKTIQDLKLDESLSRNQIDEMLEFIQKRMGDKEGYSKFMQDHQKMNEDALGFALDPTEMERVYGSLDKPTSKQNFLNKVLGDHQITVNDILGNPDKFRDNKIVDHVIDAEGKGRDVIKDAPEFYRDMMERIRQRKGDEAADKFGRLFVDSVLRKDGEGNFYSLTEASGITDKALDWLAGTMPGKILKLRDFTQRAKGPTFNYTPASGSLADPVLARLTNKVNKNALTPDSDYLRIYNRSYEITTDGLRHEKALDDTYLISRYGTQPRLINQMAGNSDYRVQENKILRALDVGQEGTPTLLDDFRSKINKFQDPEWSRNVINEFLNNADTTKRNLAAYRAADELSEEATQDVHNIINQVKQLNHFYSKNTYELNSEAVNKLMAQSSGETRQMFRLLSMNDEDMLRELLVSDNGSLRDASHHLNQDLVSLLFKYNKQPKRTRDMISIKNNRGNFFGGTETAGFFDTLRMEIGKEAFMRHAVDSAPSKEMYNFDAVNDLIEAAGLTGATKRETRRLADWAAFQQTGGVHSRLTRKKDTEALIEDADRVLNAFMEPEDNTQMNATFFKQFRENLENMSKEKSNVFENSYSTFQDQTDIVTAYNQNEWMTMRKMISPLEAIKNLNDTEKLKAFGKQFYAGRNNLEDVTSATLVPYFALIRLSDALGKIGLSFSTRSSGSIGDLTKSMVFKRGLPLVAGLTYFDYMSDMTGVLTGGTTLKGAFAQGIANMDLGMRSITDATGLTDYLKTEKEINPFYSYWTGDDYHSREEREDWYQNGYQEMRKGRWWSFGGIQEFRGSEVSYYQPNFLRRATSEWKDKALYDSVWEKWSRSWLPTPTDPLSPVRYLMNPYWLEEKHAEDRPYPMTAPMFTEQTPWGAILNPTIGELIKPKREMHADRLNSNFVDVRALIEARNIEQFEKAKGNNDNHLIRFKEGSIEPVDWTSLNAPTPSQRVLSLNVKDGVMTDAATGSYQQFSGVMSASSYLDAASSATAGNIRAGIAYDPEGGGEDGDGESGSGSGGGSGSGSGGGGFGGGYVTTDGISFRDELRLRAASGEFLPKIANQIINKADPTYSIEEVNKGIVARAQAIGSRPREKGFATPESIYNTAASFGSQVLENPEARAELKGLSGGDDFVGEMAYASRFLMGIYGYGAFAMFPGEARTKLEDAGKIDSPVRGFWDMNTGGLGGGYGEIFRRFIPSFNHMVEDFNPLMNTMPDWMPERFRFGDPYTKVPKGEMRLPGEGYESINELHPDQYGRYGAFDRFKILADISPGSAEYKVWREIALRTVKDKALRDEMDEIKDRVSEQAKKHDFYPYKFIGRSTERKVATVEEVLNNNYFKVVGDDRIYRMAGIEVTGSNGPDFLASYLTPGSEIVMATDKNPYRGTNDDEHYSVNAAVFINGQNINRQLLKDGNAEKRENDRSAAAAQGLYSDAQMVRGHIYEALSHAPIPFYSQKFFRIRDPLESYKQEQTYGTPFASWSHPIESFLRPGFERALMSDTETAIGVGALVMNQVVHNKTSNKGAKFAANAALMLTNRGAFIGGFIGMGVKGGGLATKRMAQVGAVAQMAGWLYTRSDQPIEGTLGFAAVGAFAGHVLKDVGIKKGGLIGAAAGLAITGSRTNLLSDGLDKTWIPERTKEKWELQEYFDRLEYIKYSGLYEKAARKAHLLEGTNIKKLVNNYEKSKLHADRMIKELEEYRKIVREIYPEGDYRGERLISEIDAKLDVLDDKEMMMSVGKWGRTALIYKQAMDSTIYGLQENASWSQLLRSLPTNERDYFIEFAAEKDPEKRKEILKYVSPYQQKVLRIAWGEKPKKQESNASFFQRHRLPTPGWAGWRPNVDLKDVEAKTIVNEGMLLSDFGHYESETRDPNVVNAPNLNPHDNSNTAEVRANLIAALKGFGLTGVNVSVEPTSRDGIEVVANVIQTTTYNVQQKIKDMFSF